MRFLCDATELDITIVHAIVAGWTGRDRAAIDHHIQELAALGVAPPSDVPLFYRVSASLLTDAKAIEAVGEGTSGEVEPLFVRTTDGLYLGLASDHTDRDLETHSVALSKQACAKPAADALWAYDSVKDHLDAIEMRSWIYEGGDWVLYQEGTLSAIRPLGELIKASGINEMSLAEGEAAAMLCGTFGAKGGVRAAPAFRMELHDPVRDRTMSRGYKTTTLPIIV